MEKHLIKFLMLDAHVPYHVISQFGLTIWVCNRILLKGLDSKRFSLASCSSYLSLELG